MFRTYYNFNEELKKYNALTNFVLSDRRDGKTSDIKIRGFINYIDHKGEYVYVRRNDSEFEKSMYETFYNDIITLYKQGKLVCEDKRIEKLLDYDFLHTKSGVYIREKGTKTWGKLCSFIPLSKSGKLKSALAIENIETIEYDEFVPLDGRYLKNEMQLLMELYKSVDSDRDKTLLNLFGNRIDEFNPFFDYFDIHLGIQKERIKLYKGGTVAVQIYVNEEHREKRKESRFNKMVAGTEYEDYNNGGTLIDRQIKIRCTDGAKYFSAFKTQLGDGSIYVANDCIIISSNNRKDGFIITDKIYDLKREQYLCTYGEFPAVIKDTYKQGKIFYTTKEV